MMNTKQGRAELTVELNSHFAGKSSILTMGLGEPRVIIITTVARPQFNKNRSGTAMIIDQSSSKEIICVMNLLSIYLIV